MFKFLKTKKIIHWVKKPSYFLLDNGFGCQWIDTKQYQFQLMIWMYGIKYKADSLLILYELLIGYMYVDFSCVFWSFRNKYYINY